MSLESSIVDVVARLRQGRFQNEQAVSQGIVLPILRELNNAFAEQIKVTPILTLPGWLVTNRVMPTGNEIKPQADSLRDCQQQCPSLDDKRLKQIGYQLELKCRDVEF